MSQMKSSKPPKPMKYNDVKWWHWLFSNDQADIDGDSPAQWPTNRWLITVMMMIIDGVYSIWGNSIVMTYPNGRWWQMTQYCPGDWPQWKKETSDPTVVTDDQFDEGQYWYCVPSQTDRWWPDRIVPVIDIHWWWWRLQWLLTRPHSPDDDDDGIPLPCHSGGDDHSLH